MVFDDKKQQIKAPRVTPLEGVSTYALRGIRVRGVENTQGFGIDERRFVDSIIQNIFANDPERILVNSPQRAQSSQRIFQCLLLEIGKVLLHLNRTRMTQIGRIFTDPCVSASSVQSVFYRSHSRVKNPLSAFICVDPSLINRAGGA